MSEFGNGGFRERLMFAGLQVAKAWQMLNGGNIGHLTTEQYMDLCRDAGYTEQAAQKAGTMWANKRLDVEQPI